MGFTTTNNDEWTFSFQDPKPVFDTEAVNAGQTYLAAPGRWENYSDDELYEMEVLLRQFLETKKNGWGTHSQAARKFTTNMMHQILYGTPSPGRACGTVRKLNRLMNHYATRVWKKHGTTVRGERVNGKIYMLSARRLEKPPYSLRLRLEWMAEQGILPTWHNMQLSEQLKPGETRTANNAKYRAKAVRYVRKQKRDRNDKLYGKSSRKV